jgi:hypothetical protein
MINAGMMYLKLSLSLSKTGNYTKNMVEGEQVLNFIQAVAT